MRGFESTPKSCREYINSGPEMSMIAAFPLEILARGSGSPDNGPLMIS